MKSLFLTLGLLIGLNAHAGYKAEELNHWFSLGTTEGVDKSGKACKISLTRSSLDGAYALEVVNANVEDHKIPRFNQNMSNELEKIEESGNTLFIILKSKPSNSYTSPVRQTLTVKKTSKGTEVDLVQKDLKLFGKTLKGYCIVD